MVSYGRSNDVLKHKNFNKNWTPEEKLELVSQVLAGKANQAVAIKAGISDGMLYQWAAQLKAKKQQSSRNSVKKDIS